MIVQPSACRISSSSFVARYDLPLPLPPIMAIFCVVTLSGTSRPLARCMSFFLAFISSLSALLRSLRVGFPHRRLSACNFFCSRLQPGSSALQLDDFRFIFAREELDRLNQ